MIDDTLQEKMLDAPLIINDFVKGEPECNYERYLVEMINHSKLFMQKSGGKPFQWEECQAHGECDAVSENYSVDFKLLATRSSLQGQREISSSITKMADGVNAFGIGRWPRGKVFKAVRAAAALRRYSFEELHRIAINPIGKIEEDVSRILKSLRVQKNLLLFYPFEMSFSVSHTFSDGCNKISEAFNEDLHNISLYRRSEVPDYETFLCTIYDQKLLIFQNISGYWKLDDFVEVSSSRIFMDLYLEYGNNGFNF